MALQKFPRICPTCEASCGLVIEADQESGEVGRVSGDPDHPSSQGYVCPKSQAIKALREDPDRLRKPLIREGGSFREASWDEALDYAAAGLKQVLAQHGPQALGVYLGNPTAHVAALQMVSGPLLGAMPALLTGAAAIDNFARNMVGAFLYGNIGNVPVPDVDRTEFFLIFGANPLVSHGSMFGAPGMPNRLKRLKARGARLVVVDPRRTATAELADDHFAIRPGTDALLALAMIDTLFEERLVRLGRLEGHISGLDDLRAVAAKFPPTRVAALTGIAPERIAQLARDFAAAGSAAAYCRVGVNTQSFGTLGVWAIDCLNVLTGNCDAEGGVIFPEGSLPVFTHDAYAGDQPPYGRWQSRVSGAPELGGTVPTHAMWEDIETPGPGRVRGMTIIAGNPVLSNPNARRVAAALDSLDFLVAVDIYLNETTRLADVILPPGDHLRHSEFTLIWNNWMVEDVVSWSPRILPPDPTERTDWSIINGLAARMAGMDEPAYDLRCAVEYLTRQAPRLPRLPVGAEIADLLARADGEDYPERIFDVLLRCGKNGDGFGSHPGGLSLTRLRETPAGISYGPMEPGRFPAAIATPDGKLALAAAPFLADVPRLEQAIVEGKFAPGTLRLIGRREMRSNNSWMHNLRSLVKGPKRCTAMINPADATRLGIAEDDEVRLRSRVGEITLPARLTDEVGIGTVCVPHGWSEPLDGSRLGLAHSLQGANYNRLSDDAAFDVPSGCASFNGTPIVVERVDQAAEQRGAA